MEPTRLSATTDNLSVVHCPKPNHIKPCWCGGRARCLDCRRIVKGSAVRCWQHRRDDA